MHFRLLLNFITADNSTYMPGTQTYTIQGLRMGAGEAGLHFDLFYSIFDGE